MNTSFSQQNLRILSKFTSSLTSVKYHLIKIAMEIGIIPRISRIYKKSNISNSTRFLVKCSKGFRLFVILNGKLSPVKRIQLGNFSNLVLVLLSSYFHQLNTRMPCLIFISNELNMIQNEFSCAWKCRKSLFIFGNVTS